MSASEAMQKELEDIELKVRNAREAAAAPGASERDKSDLKLIEQDYLAAQQKARRADANKPGEHPTDPKKKLDKKLDDALKASFPGSDPVSFVEAAPVNEQDRSLPAVEVGDRQAGKKTDAARKSR